MYYIFQALLTKQLRYDKKIPPGLWREGLVLTVEPWTCTWPACSGDQIDLEFPVYPTDDSEFTVILLS